MIQALTAKATAEGRLGYRLLGTGTGTGTGAGTVPVMVLHGWLSDSASWARLWPELDTLGYTWCFPDARGYGLSRELTGAYTSEEFAADTLELADSLDWNRFCLVGHSMSGVVIQHALLSAPQRVRTLIGLSPVPASGAQFDMPTMALFRAVVTDPALRQVIIDRSTAGRRSNEWVRLAADHSQSTSRQDAVSGYLESWAHADLSARVSGSPVPVGVVIGAHDPSLTATRMRTTWLQWYPNSSLDVVATAGHYPMDEAPHQLADIMHRLLASVRGDFGIPVPGEGDSDALLPPSR